MTAVTTGDGFELAVYSAGEDAAKPTVVLVHGFPDDHTAWDGIVEHLVENHRVVTYDTRGAGTSDKPRRIADYRLDQLAADLRAVLDHVDTGAGVHLVGHDWGSVQAWHLITGPQRHGILSFTSISGPCVDHIPGWVLRKVRARRFRDIVAMWKSPLYMGLFSIPLVAPVLARIGLIDPVIRLSLKAFEQPEPLDPRPHGPSARRNAPSIRIYAANVLPRLLEPVRGGTDVPVQVLTPRRDIFIPPVTQGDPHPDIATIDIREVPGGHWAPTYNPTAVGDLVAGWIARHRQIDGQRDMGSEEVR